MVMANCSQIEWFISFEFKRNLKFWKLFFAWNFILVSHTSKWTQIVQSFSDLFTQCSGEQWNCSDFHWICFHLWIIILKITLWASEMGSPKPCGGNRENLQLIRFIRLKCPEVLMLLWLCMRTKWTFQRQNWFFSESRWLHLFCSVKIPNTKNFWHKTSLKPFGK